MWKWQKVYRSEVECPEIRPGLVGTLYWRRPPIIILPIRQKSWDIIVRLY